MENSTLQSVTSMTTLSTNCTTCFTVGFDQQTRRPLVPELTIVCSNETKPVECAEPFTLEREGYVYGSYGVHVYGIVTPIILPFIVVTNLLVCVVLCRRNMRTPTNMMLAAMAISDMLTGLWPLPAFVHFYSLGNHNEWLPYSWCYAYGLVAEVYI